MSCRTVLNDCFLNGDVLEKETGITIEALAKSIEACYATLDVIDSQLMTRHCQPISKLMELANFSSMLSNLLCSELVEASNGLYLRNQPHTYPDLLPVDSNLFKGIEIKTALETNKPKGHLPKAGYYLTFRYVLGDNKGNYQRGKDARGDTAWIWEVRAGHLAEEDFDISNTPGDSGKTAVIKTKALERMTPIYFVPERLPYARIERYKNANGIESKKEENADLPLTTEKSSLT